MKWALALLLSNSLGFWDDLGSTILDLASLGLWSKLGDLVVANPNGVVRILTGVGNMLFGASTTSEYDQATGFPQCKCCRREQYGICDVSRVCIACCDCKHCEWIAINRKARGN